MTETPVQRSPLPYRLLISPLTLLERTRGRKRSLLILLYVLILAISGVLLWRAASLRGLPDVGDPFDIGAFSRSSEVPDEQNAAILYRQAGARLKEFKNAGIRFDKMLDWDTADEPVRVWSTENHEALEIWLKASRQPRALWVAPETWKISTLDGGIQDISPFTRLALLEGSRRAHAGNPSAAAELYGGILRSTAHFGMSAGAMPRYRASGSLRSSIGRILDWSSDPRVEIAALRRVLDDAVASDAMTSPPSEMLKVEYLTLRNELDSASSDWRVDPEVRYGEPALMHYYWYNYVPGSVPVGLFMRHEPERSRRVARLLFANWLSYCDRPAPPPAAPTRVWLYQVDATAPPSTRALPPEEIEVWFKSTTWTRLLVSDMSRAVAFARGQQTILRSLQITLAERCYQREHGGKLPGRLGDLVGPYLQQLPDGYSADDPGSAVETGPTESKRKQ
jgi:hypothetical protein